MREDELPHEGSDEPSPAISTGGPAAVRSVRRSFADFRAGPPVWTLLLTLVAVGCAVVAVRASGFGSAWLWNDDMPKLDYPLAVFFHDALAHGRLPLWNDNLGLGYPLYAEGQIGAFYPPNWLIFQLPPLTALDVTRLLHLTLAGVGTGLLALRVSGNRGGALLACAVAILGGAIVTKLEWTNLVVAYGWMPWVLLPLARRPGPTPRGLVLAGVCWGIQALAGHPNTWLLTGVSAVVLMLAISPRRATLMRIAGFGCLGGAIGAVQLLPTLLLTGMSVRSLGLSPDDAFTAASTGFDPLGFGFANAFARGSGNGWNQFTNWYPDGIFALLEGSAYVGLPVLALAAAGFTARRARPWLALAAVMVAIPVVAAFRPAIWLSVPILNGLRSPVRSYVVLSLVLGLIAALGVARLRRSPRPWLPAAVVTGSMVAMYGATLLVAQAAPQLFDSLLRAFSSNLDQAGAEAERVRAVAVLTVPLPVVPEILIGGAAVVAMALVESRRAATAALVVLAATPLLAFSPQANQLRPESEFSSAQTPFVQALRQAGAHRVLTIDRPGWYEGMPDHLAAEGVPDLEMFSSLDLLDSDQLLDQARNGDDAEDVRLAIGVDVVVTFGKACPGELIAELSSPDAFICRSPNALKPPYWIPVSAVPVLAGSGNPAAATLDIPTVLSEARSVTVVSWSPDGDELTIDAPSDGYVWIDRSWWPQWSASVDGTPAAVYSAMAGQLVAVPAGRHTLSQRLVPWDAALGLLAGLAALAIALAWLYLGRRRADRTMRGG